MSRLRSLGPPVLAVLGAIAFASTSTPVDASTSPESNDDGSIAGPSTKPGSQRAGWELRYSETFGESLPADTGHWVRDDYDPADQINWVDDNGSRLRVLGGDAFTAQLNTFTTYTKEFKFGDDNWLTASLSARAAKTGEGDSFNDPTLRPTITQEVLPGAGTVARINVPSHTGGALIRNTKPLPEYYRIEYDLKALDTGGKRDGSLEYDGRYNGYDTAGCKTLQPWEAFRDLPYCEWSNVREGGGAYNGMHYLSIIDQPDMKPRNRIIYHTIRKVLIDGYNDPRPDLPPKYAVCNAKTGEFYPYADSNFTTIDALFLGPQGKQLADYGGNRQMFRTPCGNEPPGLSSAAEMKPELMPKHSYRFAVERDKTGYTMEISGDFKHVGQQTFRFHRNFIENEDGTDVPIWHYNVTPDGYDGQFNGRKEVCRDGQCASWENTWPKGSAYPDSFVLGDVYTNVYEGSAAVDNIRLYVPE